MINELREQAQAIRAEGGEQMHADLMMRAATALDDERKAREAAEQGGATLLMYAGELKQRAEAAEEQKQIALNLCLLANKELELAQEALKRTAAYKFNIDIQLLEERAEAAEAALANERSMQELEQCSYCKHWYPKPVSYHHSESECIYGVEKGERMKLPTKIAEEFGYSKETWPKGLCEALIRDCAKQISYVGDERAYQESKDLLTRYGLEEGK